jgi:L-serine dehydratase
MNPAACRPRSLALPQRGQGRPNPVPIGRLDHLDRVSVQQGGAGEVSPRIVKQDEGRQVQHTSIARPEPFDCLPRQALRMNFGPLGRSRRASARRRCQHPSTSLRVSGAERVQLFLPIPTERFMSGQALPPERQIRSSAVVASVFDLFKIGVGPSSSHTMGPMTAACMFVERLVARGLLGDVARVQTELYGSLALTGKGHATDRAVLIGLTGKRPDSLCPDEADAIVTRIRSTGLLPLADRRDIPFDEARDLRFLQRERLPHHSNGMRVSAFAADDSLDRERRLLFDRRRRGDRRGRHRAQRAAGGRLGPSVQYSSGDELLAICERERLSIAEIARANERAALPDAQIDQRLDALVDAMSACIDRGIRADGILPGGLKVKRRAPALHRLLMERAERTLQDPLTVLDWVNLWALAVNEENAAGGRVVTAPTNGAAGIVPAILRYYQRFTPHSDVQGVHTFLLTAAAIGSLFKENASISGAEVGCQGEVGVACSMAAAGLTAALGGTPGQVENAAEIGMEHNLGLTCDPVGGLVQVPCIERNAVGAIKAIEASRLALVGDGTHRVSLDQVIETMRKTGLDMNERYKETSLGGLAVNVVEC